MKQTSIQKLVLASLFLGMAIVLPTYVTQIPEIGRRLLPMHIPVLLCGFFCGWKYGLLVGILAPLLKTFFPPGPPLYPIAIAMSFELGTYGLMSAILYQLFPKKNYYIYITLISTMILGRIVYGFVISTLFLIDGNTYTMRLFISSTIIDSIPGIILQIALIPPLVLALKRYAYAEVENV